MFHFTDMQTLLLLIGELVFAVLSFWSLAVVIPARNETVDRLASRNKTLEYWMNEIQNQKEAGKEMPVIPPGDRYRNYKDLETRHVNLLNAYNNIDRLYRDLFKKCEDLQQDNDFLKSVIAGENNEKNITSEQP